MRLIGVPARRTVLRVLPEPMQHRLNATVLGACRPKHRVLTSTCALYVLMLQRGWQTLSFRWRLPRSTTCP